MIEGNIEHDIFKEEKVYYDQDEREWVSHALDNKQPDLDLRSLYIYLRRYDELCEDYKRCENAYTQSVLLSSMQTLKAEIDKYCVVRYRG